MQKTYERLAFAVRNGRKREKLTQAELAERLHMSIRTDLPITTVSKTVIDFFKDKSETETQKYIDLCKKAYEINK